MDIKSGCGWPASQLSNFAYATFEIDGIKCSSMEGFIQALKRKNPEIQKYGCTLVGIKAKYWGKGIKWWQRPANEQLWWLGESFPAHGDKHLEIVEKALRCKFTQHDGSKRALIATQNAVLKHSIGNNDRTSLKANDFCRLLMKIREEIQNVTK
jgi:predicted NAD-dependent protein-ADP-ribosyltransferase YbiA (DUF1768 family)